MATNKAELEALRAEYRKVRARATAKVNRTKKSTGARLAGSKYDPRAAVGHEKRLGAKQLRSAIGRMEKFNDRKTQFGSIAYGQPIPMAKLREAEKLQARYNEQRLYLGRRINNQVVPNSNGLTYLQSRQRYQSVGNGGNTPLDFKRMNPRRMENERAVDSFIRDTKRKMTPQQIKKDMLTARIRLRNLANYETDDPELVKRFDNLSDDGIYRLYGDQEFMDALAITQGSPPDAKYSDDVVRNRSERVETLLSAAEQYEQ